MVNELDNMMSDWEKELFGGHKRQCWAGAEVHHMASSRDESELKPGTPIFGAKDPHAEAARRAWDQTRPRDPEAERRFQDEFYLDLHGREPTPKDRALQEIMGKIAEICTPPSTQKNPDDYTVGVDVSSQPDAVGVSTMIHTDTGTAPASKRSGLFGDMDTPGDPGAFFQVGSDLVEELEHLQCHLTEPSGVYPDPDMIDYDLLHAEGLKRVTGRIGWHGSGGKIVLAFHHCSEFPDTGYYIGHVPTGCLLHYPGFRSLDTASQMCDQLGHFFSEYIDTSDPRRMINLFGNSAASGAAARWFQHVLETDQFIGWTKWYFDNER